MGKAKATATEATATKEIYMNISVAAATISIPRHRLDWLAWCVLGYFFLGRGESAFAILASMAAITTACSNQYPRVIGTTAVLPRFHFAAPYCSLHHRKTWTLGCGPKGQRALPA
jgi:hypothetical protein